MRIGELSRRTGVPVPTIKYYLREGLLPPGERTHANQVSYAETHVRRLRLVRAMIEVGNLPITSVRELVVEVDSPDRDMDSLLGLLQKAMSPRRDSEAPDLSGATELVRRHGLDPTGKQDHLRTIAEVQQTFQQLGLDHLEALGDAYARAAKLVAAADVAAIAERPDRDSIAESMIIGTVLGDALFAALRRLAHVGESQRTFRAPTPQH